MQNNIKPLFTPNKEQIKQHLEFLFKDCRGHDDGKIEIAYTPSNSPAVNKAEFFDVDDIDKAADFAYDKNANEGVNVYVGAALREPDTAPFGRSNTDDYYASYVVWCDLDDAQAAKTAKDKYKDLPPSMVVVTGREPNTRAQAWWKLQTLEEDKTLLKDNLAHICNALGGDPAVVDPARVMRLGGTIAYPKKGGRVTECTEVIVPPNPTKMVNINKFKSYFDIPQDAPLISNQDTAFKNPITGTFKIDALLQESRVEGKWHSSIRDAISSMVGKGWTDEQIRIATNPYRRDRSLVDDMITPLITTARNKYNHPEPPPKIDDVIKESFDPETGEIVEGVSKFKPKKGGEISINLSTTDFVKGVLYEQSIAVLYGESGTGKSFFALDLAAHVSEGKPWRDLRVNKGAVLYVSMEGKANIENRIATLKDHYGMALDSFYLLTDHVNMFDPSADIKDLILCINEIQKNEPISLIVLDTLARAMAGGDENSSQDMGILINHADILKDTTGACIKFVHHSGKDATKGMRGSGALKAGIDTEIEIIKGDENNPHVATILKQKEGVEGVKFGFSLSPKVVGVNKYEEEVSTCVVEIKDAETENNKSESRSKLENDLYNSLVRAIDDYGVMKKPEKEMDDVKVVTYVELYDAMEKRGYKELHDKDGDLTAKTVKGSTYNIRARLREKGYIGFNDRFIWLS